MKEVVNSMKDYKIYCILCFSRIEFLLILYLLFRVLTSTITVINQETNYGKFASFTGRVFLLGKFIGLINFSFHN